jgi:hypothetical protein
MRLFGAFAVTFALVVSACGDSSATGACVETREPEDPASLQHVLDPDGVVFQTDPPTSGPHLSGPPVSGRFEAPITAAAQVRALEDGRVVVQYTDAAAGADLAPLSDDRDVEFVIAPATTLPAPVVATAWTWKLTCSAIDLDRIRAFGADRVGDAPGID